LQSDSEKGDSELVNIVTNQVISELKEKYKLSNNEVKKALEQALSNYIKEPENSFPISIINKKLTVLESIVKFLKEEKKYSFRKIASLISRNEKNLWHTYKKAKDKMSGKLAIKKDVLVPLKVLQETKLSPLEAVVFFLRTEKELSLHEIAVLLSRDDRTVWTVLDRAKKKNV